jgi:GTPase
VKTGVDRLRELLTNEDIEKIEESHKMAHMTMVIEVDKEFGNLLIKLGNRTPKTSGEGMAFVTIGVDENGEIVYISIEPEDEGLASLIKNNKLISHVQGTKSA